MRYAIILFMVIGFAAAANSQQRFAATNNAVALKIKLLPPMDVVPAVKQNKTEEVAPIPIIINNTVATQQPGFYSATLNQQQTNEKDKNRIVAQLKPSGNNTAEGFKELLSHPIRINLGNASVFVSKRGLGLKFYIFRPFK